MSLILKFKPVLADGTLVNKEVRRIETDSFAANNKAVFSYPIEVKNLSFTFQSLQQIGAENIMYNEGQQWIFFEIDNIFMRISPGSTKPLLDIYGNITQQQALDLREEIEEQYTQLLQNSVYEKIKLNAEEKGLILENETLQEDQTIVLTYNIPG